MDIDRLLGLDLRPIRSFISLAENHNDVKKWVPWWKRTWWKWGETCLKTGRDRLMLLLICSDQAIVSLLSAMTPALIPSWSRGFKIEIITPYIFNGRINLLCRQTLWRFTSSAFDSPMLPWFGAATTAQNFKFSNSFCHMLLSCVAMTVPDGGGVMTMNYLETLTAIKAGYEIGSEMCSDMPAADLPQRGLAWCCIAGCGVNTLYSSSGTVTQDRP